MNDYLLQAYVDRITKEEINDFAVKKGITLEDSELDIIYEYLKKYWRTFYYGNPISLLQELKSKLNYNTYCKLENLYMQAKDKLNQ